MKRLEFRIISFGKGEKTIENVEKRASFAISRKELKKMIKNDPSLIGLEIPVIDVAEKDMDR